MSKVKETLYVEQFRLSDGEGVGYRVVKAVNTTEPSIGDVLRKPDMDAIIGIGTTVYITMAS